MRSDIVPGAMFPDYELSDHAAKRRKLSELQGQHPMVLVLSRGGFCPKDRRQAEGLVQLHRELEVAYRRLVTISTDNITAAEWLAQQIVEAFPWDTAPRYLVQDNDAAYGQAFTNRIRTMGIRDRPIAPRSPWQNPYVERLIGTLRRECLDHVLIFGERHLHRVLALYSLYYNETQLPTIIGQWPKNVSGGRNRRRPRINAKPISMWPGRGWKPRLDRIAGLPLRRQPCGPSIQSIEVRC